MTREFVDFHSHLLPALDDGATDLRESLEMARILASFGFTTVHCTPHMIKGGFENTPQRVRQATDSLQRRLDEAGIALRLVAGTEHYLDEYLSEQVPEALTVGASRYLLVEAPFRSSGELLPAMVASLKQRGLFPLFAHPERCRVFHPPVREEGVRGALSFVLGRRKAPDLEGSLLFSLKDAGCRFQGNLGSFAGGYGSEVKQRAVFYLTQGLYCCLGSDAHRPEHLEDLLSSGLEVVVAEVGEAAAHELLSGRALI
jgi:protein-tyrosine phosphatase